MTSLHVWFCSRKCPKPNDSQFTVKNDNQSQQILSVNDWHSLTVADIFPEKMRDVLWFDLLRWQAAFPLSYITVNWIFLRFVLLVWQNKTFNSVLVGTEKLQMAISWTKQIIREMFGRLIKKIFASCNPSENMTTCFVYFTVKLKKYYLYLKTD